MKKIILLIFIILLSNLLIVNVTSVFAQSGEIKGKVLPIDSNAIVYALQGPKDSIYIKIYGAALTRNEDGTYDIRLPSGKYNLVVVAAGYYLNKSLTNVEVVENGTTIVENIALEKSFGTGSISGTVEPTVKGATVIMWSSGLNGIDIIDEEGKFRISDLKPAAYQLFVPDTTTRSFHLYKRDEINIGANENLSGYDLVLTPAGKDYLIDRLIVEFNNSVTDEEVQNILEKYNSQVMNRISNTKSFLINVPKNMTTTDLMELLKSENKIKKVFLDKISSLQSKGVTDKAQDSFLENLPNEVIDYPNLALSTNPAQNQSSVEENGETNKKITKSNSLLYFGAIILALVILFMVTLFYKVKISKNEK